MSSSVSCGGGDIFERYSAVLVAIETFGKGFNFYPDMSVLQSIGYDKEMLLSNRVFLWVETLQMSPTRPGSRMQSIKQDRIRGLLISGKKACIPGKQLPTYLGR